MKRHLIDEPAAEAIAHWTRLLGDPLFVYFIQAEDGGPVKIGQALNPLKRMMELQVGNPQNLVIRAVLLAAIDSEEHIHSLWVDKAAMRGEWFGLGHEDEILRCACEASARQMTMGVGYYTAASASTLVREAMQAPGWVRA